MAAGNADAEAWLGAVLLDRGADREALRRIQRAADAGSSEGAHRLAHRLRPGPCRHAAQRRRALELFEKAAAAGHTRAQINLGILYLRGQGVPRDVIKARAWLEKAAASGDPRRSTRSAAPWTKAQGRSRPIRCAPPISIAAPPRRAMCWPALRYGLALSEGNGIKRDVVAAQQTG